MIQLTKQSSNNEIQLYFEKVRALRLSKEEFPVNFDEVWPLVYENRGNAKRDLVNNFIDGIDFNLIQNDKVVSINNLKNGIKYEAYISISCMEWFIARKVRSVFEIYRQVFHQVMNNGILSEIDKTDMRLKEATWLINALRYNDSSRLKLAHDVIKSGIPLPEYSESQDQLLSATELLKRNGTDMSTVKFNMMMLKHGYLVELEREGRGKDKKKIIKRFKSLTEKGLEFGENLVSPANPRETQPMYHVSKFPQLLNTIC